MEQIFKDFLQAISPALQATIIALATLLLGQINLYAQKKYEQIKASVASDKRYLLDFIVLRAVETVEQLYKDEAITRKKDEAILITQAALKDFGVSVDVDVIADAIEAAVFAKNRIQNEYVPKG